MRGDAGSQRAVRQLETEVKTKKLLAALGERLQQAHGLPSLTQRFFEQLAHMPLVHQATLYSIDASNISGSHLLLAGAYGTDQVPLTIERGEGLLGQCAVDGISLNFDVPPDCWRVSGGLGSASPVRCCCSRLCVMDNGLA